MDATGNFGEVVGRMIYISCKKAGLHFSRSNFVVKHTVTIIYSALRSIRVLNLI